MTQARQAERPGACVPVVTRDSGDGSPRDHNAVDRGDAAMAASFLRARRYRDTCFPDGLFSDPAWDMLLGLFAAAGEGKTMSVTEACLLSTAPVSTAIRWIDIIERKGLVSRFPDTQDRRRIRLRLERPAVANVNRWLDHILPVTAQRS